MLKINLITNAGPHSGVGHHAVSLGKALEKLSGQELELQHWLLDGNRRRLEQNGRNVYEIPVWPGRLNTKPITWLRLGLHLKKMLRVDPTAIVHATNQSLSFILKNRPRSVVTVHDIIELTDPQTTKGRLLYRYLYSGIPQAHHIIAVSRYTADVISRYYNLPPERITVIPNGVSEYFFPIPDFSTTIASLSLRKELKIEQAHPVILSVGSDHPRKNLNGSLRAFALVLKKYPRAVFLKMGEPGLAEGRAATLRVIDELGIKDHVRMMGDISGEKLNEIYNSADMLVFPSLAEGFGLPVLEAMAAGTPVVTSNVSSLPEVAGERPFGRDEASAALLVDPNNTEEIAQGMQRIIGDQVLAADLRQRGLQRAKLFTWKLVAKKTMGVYQSLT